MYANGHVICVFRSVGMDGDYFCTGAVKACVQRSRVDHGKYHQLVQELRIHECHLQAYFRMTRGQFDNLLSIVGLYTVALGIQQPLLPVSISKLVVTTIEGQIMQLDNGKNYNKKEMMWGALLLRGKSKNLILS